MFDTVRRTKTYDIESDTMEETLGADELMGKHPETALEEPFEELLEETDEPDDLVGAYTGVLEDQRGRERQFRIDINKRGGGLIAGGGIIAPIPTEYEAEAAVEPTPAVKKTGEALEKVGSAVSKAGAVTAEYTLIPAFEGMAASADKMDDRWNGFKQKVYDAAATEYDAEITVLADGKTLEQSYLGLDEWDARTKAKKTAKNAVPDIRSSPSAVYKLDDGDKTKHYALTASCAVGSHNWTTSTKEIDEETYEELLEDV